MNSSSTGLSDLFQRALSEYPVKQIGEGLTQSVARTDIEQRIPERIRNILSEDSLVVKASAGQGRWTSIPWIAIMDSRETTRIQSGIYAVYLFEPQEERVTLTLNQGVTDLKDDLGTAKAREKLEETARGVRTQIQPDGFTAESLDFPHASNRNTLYGPGTIFYKRYTLDNIPDDEQLQRDLRTLVECYQAHVSTDTGTQDPTVFQAPIKTGDGPVRSIYEMTVKEGVPRADIENICPVPVDQETVRVWGNQEDTSADSGDYLLFSEQDGRYEGEYTLLARIAGATVLDPETASDFANVVGWDEIVDRTFQHVIFLEPIYKANLDRNEFWDTLGFKGWPNDTYSPIDFDRDGSRFYDEYASIEEFIEQIRGQRVYPEEQEGPDPVDEYGSTEEAIADVREQLAQAETGSDWLLDQLGRYLVREWSLELSGYKPSDEVSASTAAKFDQLRKIYERLEPSLKARATELGVGSLEAFPPETTLFLGWIRVLQEDLEVEGAVLSQPRLNSILKDTYSITTESEEETVDTDYLLTRHIQTTDATLYKFTAPPDFWLTTYEYAALGFSTRNRDIWANLEDGDVIVFHSLQDPGREILEAQNAGILGAGIVRSTTTKPDDETWWYDERLEGPPADSFPYLVTFEHLYATGDIDAVDLSTGSFDKAVEILNANLAALTENTFSFNDADAISSRDGNDISPHYQTITSLGDPDRALSLAAELAPKLQTVPSVAMHESFEGNLDPDPILRGLYFPNDQGEEIITQYEAALRSGKHIILTGPPGTGKTEIARRVCSYLATEYPYLYSDYQLTTATADWSTFDTVGGYMPESNDDESDHLSFTPGVVLNRLKERKTGRQLNEPLVIDELNRADIDKAFGQLFTVLSGQSVQLPYTRDGDEIELLTSDQLERRPDPHQYAFPESWRIFATMNTYDKTSLYEMSYAFMRRFAFIRVSAPQIPDNRGGLEDMMHEYAEVWGIESEDRDRQELVDIGLVWQAMNQDVDERAIGPAIVKDILAYVTESDGVPLDERLTRAVISYIFPQLEGVPKREQIIRRIASVDRINEDDLNDAATEMLQVSILNDE